MSSFLPEAAPASIDRPAMRRAGRELLSLALMDARNHSLHLLARFDEAMAAGGTPVPERDELELPAWLGGHIAWLVEYWIGRNPQRGLGAACPADAVRLASIEPMADRWYSPALAPHGTRWQMALPDLRAVRAYLLDTLESTLELLHLAAEDDDGLYFFRAALFHEDARGEQLVAMAQALGLSLGLALPPPATPRAPLLLPATRWMLGAAPGGFSFGVERAAHPVPVLEFEIDAQAVTWSQYVEFICDGGYDRPELWLPQGWSWLQRTGRRAPGQVEQIGVGSGAVLQTLFGRSTRVASSQSAMHLSWWEADAWARWAGRRLPTEVEWEVAAHGATRQGFRWGDVHEWTAATLRPYTGYTPDAWARGGLLDPQPHFGSARVLRGASFATRARMKHAQARNFAQPQRDDGFFGFRTCAV